MLNNLTMPTVTYIVDDLYIIKLSEEGVFERKKVEESAYYQCLVALGKSIGEEDFKKDFNLFDTSGDLVQCTLHNESLKVFSEYITRLYKYHPPSINEASYKQFLNLYQRIRDDGFDEHTSMLFQQEQIEGIGRRVVVVDGHHRVSMLKYLNRELIIYG